MKTKLSTIATLLLMFISLNSFANVTLNPLKALDSKRILTTYVEAISLGTTDHNKFLFANDFEYVNATNDTKYSKKQYIKFLDSTKGLKFDCTTEYQILDESGNSCVAKAIMTFEKFVRIDYITLLKSTDGWKVSKVVTTYP